MAITPVDVKVKNPEILRLPFPRKLFEMLEDADEQRFTNIVSWNSDGHGFKVHDAAAFTKLIIPLYFKQTKYKSFQRQLCLYGFDRMSTGKQKGCRFHKNFVRGSKHLCKGIKYIGVKSRANDGDRSINKPLKSSPVDGKTSPHADISMAASESDESSFRASSVTHISPSPSVIRSGEIRTHPVSPFHSPHIISNDGAPLPSLNDDSMTEQAAYFEGMRFHLLGRQELTQTPVPTIPRAMLRQVSETDLSSHSDDIVAQLKEAWEKGFEMALSNPLDLGMAH